MKTRAKRTNTSLIARGMICFSSLLLLFALSGSAKAQGDAGGMTPPSLTPGTPFGSYPLSGFDSVNLFNGNLNFHLPLLKVGGRGATQVPVMLKIEERWRVVPFTSCSPCGPVYYATYNWWTGYQVGYGPGVLEGRAGTDGEQQDIDGATYPQRTLTRFTFTASDGTEFELRDAISNGAPQLVDLSQPLHPHFYLRGSVFTTADGSSATFISCQPDGTLLPIYDDTVAPAYPAGYLLLGDGTRYRIDGGLVRWIQDRNGNRVNFYYEHVDQFGSADGRVTKIVDSLNRQVTFSYDVDAGGQYGICDEINYQGFAGTPRTIRISKGGLGTALRPDFPRTRPMSYLFPDVPGSDQTRFSPTVITAVWLADGTSSYKFYYNDYGELARVELPSGGATEYDWGAGMNNALTGGVINGTAIYRRVLERRVYPSSAAGTAYESRMTYSVPETWVPPIGPPSNAGYVDVKEYGSDPNTALLANRHYFYGSATVQPLSVEYSPWKTGKEYKTEAFDSDGVTALQRGEQTFLQTSPGWWTGTADDAPENNPRLTDSKSTLVQTGQVAKQHYEYDGYNNQKVIEEYDYGISSPPTYPVRRTEIDHVTTNESNNIDYTGTGIEADVNHRPYLRSLPQERRVYAVSSINGAKTLFAQTHFYYDQTAAQNRASLVGHDALYDTTYNKRGNLTSAVAWLNTGEPITTSLQYDIAGNVVQTTDGRGKASVIEFASSSNTYAFATTVKSAVPDATGQHGSTQQFITQYDYDLASGLLKTITNANGQVTTASYANDPFDRLKGITPPAGGGQKSFFYSDTPGNLYVQTQQQQDASTTLTATVRFDGLGRAYRSEQSEGSGSIFVDTVYGDLGRVSQVSNPYRTGDTVRYTTTAYDGLGRVHTVTAPGGASVTTDYLGNAVTVTDPAAKSKKTVSDALGRTIQVIEDPGDSSHLNYQTTYVYDVLNNLRQVTQGSGSTQQKRYYLYDSLGRLIRASNPEQEINTSLTPAMTDPITGRSQWSMALTYDSNGNLLTRTDPRNVTANYYYDDLNRVYKRDYTNNINQTPTVNFTYDGIGSTAQYALGQLTLVSASSISGFASSYSYDNF
ncbi:MAG TPA: hypothetical protein VJ464_08170, partial [Blastocatellia bacterium]|nr:hypothetical protein [Blastocatellia bacterium]